MWMYRRFGRAAAWAVARSAFLRKILRPLFDAVLDRAIADQVIVETVLYAR
jgi:hypothetical protein